MSTTAGSFRSRLGAVLAAPLGAGAQQAGKVYRIGVLSSSSAIAYRDNLDISSERTGFWRRTGGPLRRSSFSPVASVRELLAHGFADEEILNTYDFARSAGF